ncbi:MAG: flagellar hook-basal body complex protein FliE [Nevskia sp.]|nr:flagellar hook-basal body complex protein FliE [Nevskia sp.]
MSDISVNSVLAQIRALSAQASTQQQKPAATQGGNDGFGTLMQGSVDRVNNAQNEATRMQKAFEMGDPNTDLSSVMLATTKAQVSFRSMVEVRNRVIAAYQDIMNMPL